VAAAQTLTVEGTCGQGTTATADGGVASAGRIVLTSAGCAAAAAVALPSGEQLTSTGTIDVSPGAGGARSLTGTLRNRGPLVLHEGTLLALDGDLLQNEAGTLQVRIASASQYGRIAVTGAASFAGILRIEPLGTYKAKANAHFAVLTAASRSGVFGFTFGQLIKQPRYYRLDLTDTSMAFTVTVASFTVTPAGGAARGDVIQIAATGYQPGEELRIALKDAKKRRWNLGTLIADATGSASGSFTVFLDVRPGPKCKLFVEGRLSGAAPQKLYPIT
jgi:hypothetical protein